MCSVLNIGTILIFMSTVELAGLHALFTGILPFGIFTMQDIVRLGWVLIASVSRANYYTP